MEKITNAINKVHIVKDELNKEKDEPLQVIDLSEGKDNSTKSTSNINKAVIGVDLITKKVNSECNDEVVKNPFQHQE